MRPTSPAPLLPILSEDRTATVNELSLVLIKLSLERWETKQLQGAVPVIVKQLVVDPSR